MRVQAILAALGLILAAPAALAAQAVSLRAAPVDDDGLVTLGDIFANAGSAGSIAVAPRTGRTLMLDARTVQAAASRAGLYWPNAEAVSRIVVVSAAQAAPSGAASAGAVAARGNVEVLTYARSLAAGEIVQPQDLVWARLAAAPADAPSEADQVIGLAARRPVRAGAAVSSRDVGAAQVIRAGEMITVRYDADGVSLALQGKAMANGAQGEPVAVQNLQSKKVIQAIVTGPGEAVVGPYAIQARSLPSRYAAR